MNDHSGVKDNNIIEEQNEEDEERRTVTPHDSSNRSGLNVSRGSQGGNGKAMKAGVEYKGMSTVM
jgi:hypothetical protein